MSYGHTFVEKFGKVYSYMMDTFYSFNSFDAVYYDYINWEIITTSNTPAISLINYGLSVTESGRVVLYGGEVEQYYYCSIRQNELRRYSEMWMYDINEQNPDFRQVFWTDDVGGSTKIISLTAERLCIINSNFENQMKIIDFDLMQSYEVFVNGELSDTIMEGYSIIKLNTSDFLMVGGFNRYGDSASLLNDNLLARRISFNFTFFESNEPSVVPNQLVTKNNIGPDIGISILIGLVSLLTILILFNYFGKKKSTGKMI